MRDPHESPDPELPANEPAQPRRPTSPLDPADFGTAYGMELSIDSIAKRAPAEEDGADPLAWMRHWDGKPEAD